MAIGDLLASIAGCESSVSQTSTPVLQKRKAEDDLCTSALKNARTKPTSAARAGLGSGLRMEDVRPSGNHLEGASRLSRTSNSEAKTKIAIGMSPSLSRPQQNQKNARSDTSKPAPKKNSYAEIMARAAANQDMLACLGKIQHKTLERGMTMKERKERKAAERLDKRKATSQAAKQVNGATGTAGSRAGPAGSKSVTSRSAPNGAKGSNAQTAGGNTTGSRNSGVAEEKKVKKAALATTGYTGTARPRSDAAVSRTRTPSSRPASELPPAARSRYPGVLSQSRPRRHDEDDDMDDFIDYDEDDDDDNDDDEDEPPYGRDRYDLVEEDDSDMEAGMSDIDEEERRAEYQARREDQEQEALEKRLKREKEMRRQKHLAQVRAKPGVR